MLSDIDILVQEEDGHSCLEVLKQAGYVTIQDYTVDEFVDMKSQNHFNPLFRNDVMVEIHIRLQNTREIYQQNLKEVWRDAVPIILNGVQTLRLKLSDMLIHACLHLDKHFVTEGVQFTSFNDIFNLLRSIDNGKQTTDNGKRRDVMPHVSNNEQENITDNIETQNIETQSIETQSIETQSIETQSIASLQDFWQRFESKCIKYNFADTVFRYLVMVRYYYGAPKAALLRIYYI
jgi:hypothetical protein